MLSWSAPVGNLLSWLHRPPLFPLSIRISSSCITKFKLPSTFSSAEVSCCLDEDCDDFLPWLERKAGVEISSVLSIGKSGYGRSLLASKSIHAGDCVLGVPDSVQISPDNLLPEIKSLVPDEVGDVAKLALVVIVEQNMGQHSEWAPYISRLPRPGEMHNTIFWSEKEMEMIRQSSVYEETIRKNAHIEKEFFAIKPVLDRFRETFNGITFDVFQHAYALVESRAWRSTRGLWLIPFADFLNHDGSTESSEILDNESRELSEVIADHNYAPGEQVLVRYGKFSNATLLLNFGFTLPYNIYDEIQIGFDIPQHDPLRMQKLKLLHRHCTPTMEDVSSLSFQDSFTLKEVRSPGGRGRGIPQSLRAFARVLCSTSSEELRYLATEAAQNDGRLARHPFKNKSREIEAHRFLLSRITRLIEEHNVSIQSLDLLGSPVPFGELALRRQMARHLLSGELRVLKSTSEWLERYCTKLAEY